MIFYFTYGVGDCQEQAFQYGGWTEVEAPDSMTAVEIFRMAHPPVHGLLPCCSVALTEHAMRRPYSQHDKRCMLEEGNGGKFCRERLSLNEKGELVCLKPTQN